MDGRWHTIWPEHDNRIRVASPSGAFRWRTTERTRRTLADGACTLQVGGIGTGIIVEREFNEEWLRLEEQATAILMCPPQIEAHLPECHAVVLPSFDDCRAYTLLAPGLNAAGPVLGVRRIWQRRSDRAKLDSPVLRLKYGPKIEATIEQQQAPVGRDRLEGILGRAANLRIPPCIRDRSVGTDGESYVLSFGGLFLATRFEWWCDPPAGWEGLATLLREISDAVDSSLAT